MYKFCDTEFWDDNVTWNSEKPQLSPCFRDTVLVYIPTSLLLFAFACEILIAQELKRHKESTKIPWNWFNRLRILITFVLFGLKLVEAATYLYVSISDLTASNETNFGGNNFSSTQISNPDVKTAVEEGKTLVISSFIAPFISATCYALLVVIYNLQRKHGIFTSCTVFLYLFVLMVCDLVEFYSVIVSIRPAVFNIVEFSIKLIHSPVLVLLFLFECKGDHKHLVDTEPHDPRPISAELTASFCSNLTFWWFNKFLVAGYKSHLKLENLWRTLKRDQASEVVPVFIAKWLSSEPKVGQSKKVPMYQLVNGAKQQFNFVGSVLRAIFWPRFLFAASLKFLQDCLQFITPMVLKKMLDFMRSDNSEPVWHGVLYAILFLLLPTLQSLLLGNYFYRMQLIGQQVKTMVIGFVYRKALLLSGSSRAESTTGEIVNLMAVDSQRFQDLLLYINLVWSAPFQIVMAIALLYNELGWPIFAGVFTMALMMPLNAWLGKKAKFLQIKVMKKKDERIKQMNELLNGIKVVKLYAWENSFVGSLLSLRSKELEYLRLIQCYDSVQNFLWLFSPLMVSLVTFGVYVYADEANVLDAGKAFVSVSLFNLLRFPLTMLPMLVSSVILTMVSSRRLNKFLNSNELVRYVTRHKEADAIAIEDATLSWVRDDDEKAAVTKPELEDIELHVKPGTFVAVVGHIGSGKSSLLAAILGEMNKITGRFNICKDMTLAYVAQQAWIQNMSVRDNILFGCAYREQAYARVLEACALEPDLKCLPGGELAEIGENGINLSGGQKQRVSLARACYSDSDIYLLDDVLSALDSHVAKHVFERVLSSTSGLLRDKTRVLATNSLFVLPHADQVIVLHKGKIVECGTYSQLMAIKSGHLADYMQQYVGTRDLTTSESSSAAGHSCAASTMADTDTDSDHYYDQAALDVHSLATSGLTGSPAVPRRASGSTAEPAPATPSQARATTSASKPTNDIELREASLVTVKLAGQKSAATPTPAPSSPQGKLTELERLETGSVDYRVYLRYFGAMTWPWMSVVLVSLVASAALNVCTNIWLSIWASDAEEPEKLASGDLKSLRLIVYSVLGALQCVAILTGSLSMSKGSVNASRSLHARLLDSVMHSPMGFFDRTPIGRIVNRFAKDIDVVDSTIPSSLRSWLNCLLSVLSTIFIICFSFKYFVLIMLVLAVFYVFIQKVFIVSTRQLKRLESITRSPIYSHFGETLHGMSTIRAYDCTERFISHSDLLLDRNQSCSYPNMVANRWLSVRLELFGNIITACAALFSVYSKGSIGAGVAGLTISYSLSITQTLSWLVRMTSDLETNIVSVERILEYIANEQEDDWIKPHKRLGPDWPQQGQLEFQNFSARYRPDGELVLRNLSLTVSAGEKLGIVGRTGSGKSSLSLALFRILEPCPVAPACLKQTHDCAATDCEPNPDHAHGAGALLVDGHNVSHYGLHDVRSRLTIIPQDPVLFSGSLRFNLDPLRLHSDLELWDALERAHLKGHISSLKFGLDFQVAEYGQNFSLGQRQLICLARAILRKSKILVLDEATASVDVETDAIVQRTIREIFGRCTIITIAHRLHSILDSDRILVLERGRLLELDSPERLVARPESAFAALVRDAGLDRELILRPGQH